MISVHTLQLNTKLLYISEVAWQTPAPGKALRQFQQCKDRLQVPLMLAPNKKACNRNSTYETKRRAARIGRIRRY